MVEELVAHGVGGAAALRLAREKPAACRRALEYLPFAKFRTTKGAWLANAIRDEYGPPEGYLKARKLEGQESAKQRAAASRKQRQSREDARREEKMARLGERLRRLEEARGEAFWAFQGTPSKVTAFSAPR